MRSIRYIIPLICALFLTLGTAHAQSMDGAEVSVNLPTVALLDIEPPGPITMSFTAPSEAGAPLVPLTNNSKWLNYTSAVSSTDPSRKITAKISVTIPGLDIKLEVAAAIGSGGGNLGIPTGPVTLSTTPVNIITGIGGAYTGNGPNNGHQLTITLVPSNYGAIRAQSTNVNIFYTITGN